jgi:hypothetical protein
LTTQSVAEVLQCRNFCRLAGSLATRFSTKSAEIKWNPSNSKFEISNLRFGISDFEFQIPKLAAIRWSNLCRVAASLFYDNTRLRTYSDMSLQLWTGTTRMLSPGFSNMWCDPSIQKYTPRGIVFRALRRTCFW